LLVGETRAGADRSSTQLPGFEEGVEKNSESGVPSKNDLDMVITSYEAGEEKPGRIIFDVAARQAMRLLENSGSISRRDTETVWTRIHVGDDFAKDYQGATNAGWDGILLDRESNHFGSSKDVTIIQSLEALLPGIERYK
jgi:putative hydrolase of the HAD superfamily